ncbi:hypothetical protein E0H70_36030 [Rhizobium leguminosarum bv. viciae]|nr:hypothetical protein E0H70_36030 [Rhizobium leguminosarum bv. viciae]
MPCGPLIRLPAPTGVEPLVSTRPSDPRGEKGFAAIAPFPTASRMARPSPRLRGSAGRVETSGSTPVRLE